MVQSVEETLNIAECEFKGGLLVYVDFQGKLDDICKAYCPIEAAIQGTLIKGLDMACIGLYFDDPHNLKDPSKLRVTCGMLIRSDHSD